MKCITLTIICISYLMLVGCPSLDSGPEPQIIFRHYADPQGEFFAYTYMPYLEIDVNQKTFTPPSDEEKVWVIRLISLPSGEKLVEYEVQRDIRVEFSPDGGQVLKQLKHGDGDTSKVELILCCTKDDSELWRTTIESQGSISLITGIVWDYERDRLIIPSYTEFEFDETNKSNLVGKSRELWETPVIATIQVVRLSDGARLGALELDLVFGELTLPLGGLKYGDGKIFLPAMDDPLAKDRDTSSNQLDIFVIEPLTREVVRFDMRNMLSGMNTRLLVTADAEELFFQTVREAEDKTLSYIGNDIVTMDTTTGEWRTLLRMDKDKSYQLGGITPDGDKICGVEISHDDDGGFAKRLFTMDVLTGVMHYYEPASGMMGPYQVYITPSGKYIIEWSYLMDLHLHNLETGTQKVLASSAEHKILLGSQGIPGGYNSLV